MRRKGYDGGKSGSPEGGSPDGAPYSTHERVWSSARAMGRVRSPLVGSGGRVTLNGTWTYGASAGFVRCSRRVRRGIRVNCDFKSSVNGKKRTFKEDTAYGRSSSPSSKGDPLSSPVLVPSHIRCYMASGDDERGEFHNDRRATAFTRTGLGTGAASPEDRVCVRRRGVGAAAQRSLKQRRMSAPHGGHTN
jgi:hypothetical protein